MTRVLIACEFSGVVREAFRARGFDAWSCDLLKSEIPGKHIRGDVRDVLDDGWDMMIAFPPCTYLARSGARWWKFRREEQEAAMHFFLDLWEAPIPCIAIENPVGIMSRVFLQPDQIIHPWMFGHGETKRTCLWLKNLPLLRPTFVVDGRAPATHWTPPYKDRWKRRSRTHKGVARAMAIQWGRHAARVVARG